MGLYLWREVSATPAPVETGKVESKRPAKEPSKEPSEDEAPQPEKRPEKVAEVKRPPRDVAPPEKAAPSTTTETPVLTGGDPIAEELAKPNPKLDSVMAEANKAYDHGEFDEAKGIALKVLAKDPNNVRMLRIAVSAACIDGDSAEAQKHYAVLPGPDREAMKIRCGRYGVTFTDLK